MFNVEQLPFLYNLGYAIGHSLWQMSLVWLAYTGISAIQKWSSTQRYNLAVSAVATGFTSFIATLFYFSAKMYSGEAIPGPSFAISPASKSADNGVLQYYHYLLDALKSLAPYLSCAYILVTLLLVVRLINGFKQVEYLKTKGINKAPVDWRLFVNNHAGLLGITKKVVLHVSRFATSPLTIGFIKPVILLPLASINHLSPQQLEAVLLHELAHIKRNDYLVNIFLQVTEIVLFFNPFMRLLLKQASIERENCCDDYVLQFRYNAAEYARALLSIEQHGNLNILALGINNKNEFQLLNRVKRILSPERRAFNYKQQLGLLFVLTLITLCFTVINPVKKQQPNSVKTHQDHIAKIKNDRTFESVLPSAIQFVKNLERLGEKINKEKAEQKQAVTTSGAVENASVSQIEKRVLQLEKASHDIEKIASQFKAGENWDLKVDALANGGWMQIIAPAIKEGLKSAISIKGPVEAINGADVFLADKQLQQIQLLQKKIEKSSKKIEALKWLNLAVADSLQYLFDRNKMLALNNDALKKAKKEAVIAPFRVMPEKALQFNFQNNNLNMAFAPQNMQDADEEETEDYPENSLTPAKNADKNNCQCTSASANSTKKQVIVINGKQIADKVKKVWKDAQQQMKDGWNEDMQQKIADEIQHELQGLKNIQIKTHTNNTVPGNHSFVIEIQAEK
jgi:beta-lactamase regulating signal transducer with metallopeptidase domain